MDLKTKSGLDVNKIHFHYLGTEFSKVFGQTKKADIGWFQPLTKKTIKKKEINIDNIKTVINCFIPEEKSMDHY